jgi:hypothetical protein
MPGTDHLKIFWTKPVPRVSLESVLAFTDTSASLV